MTDVDALADFLASRRRLFVLTGAGCSTESGIPDYRDADGNWKHRQPMQYQEFVGSSEARWRYWSRSLAEISAAKMTRYGRRTGISAASRRSRVSMAVRNRVILVNSAL